MGLKNGAKATLDFTTTYHRKEFEYKFAIIYIYTLQRGCQYPKYFYCYISNGFLDMFLRAT